MPRTKTKSDAGARNFASQSCLKDMPIEEVWMEYKKTGTEEIRNFLIERYLDIVRYTAERMHMRLPSEVDVEDLMSAGLFGLMDAIDAFDLERGVKFETYCAQRIRGAIFDELRAMDWVPRLVRSRTAKVEKARKDLKVLITKGLSRAERLIVVLYYYEEMTMKEIGMTLDLSESRVSQMHSSILLRLKAQMQHRTKEL